MSDWIEAAAKEISRYFRSSESASGPISDIIRAHALLAEVRELQQDRCRRIANVVDSMPDDCTLIKTENLDALRAELAASRERERRLREMLKNARFYHGGISDADIDAALAAQEPRT